MRGLRLLVPALSLCIAAPLVAQSPVQIALFNPIQIVKEGQAVKGFRWSILYGRNTAMMGLDIGLVSMSTGTGPSGGLQLTLAGITKGPFKGIQLNGLSMVEGRFVGAQVGLVGMTHESEGLQWNAVNSSWNHRGLQLGVVNYARRTSGIQVGLVNIIKEGGQFPIMVIANWGN